MVVERYIILKSRRGQKNKWSNWKYEALFPNSHCRMFGASSYGKTEKYNSLSELAKNLSTFSNILNSEFDSDTESVNMPKGVSIGENGTMEQIGGVSDENLGELTLLIYQYVAMPQKK